MRYAERVLCGPMVRISSLPFRLLALEYGADVVFSEELDRFSPRTMRSRRERYGILWR